MACTVDGRWLLLGRGWSTEQVEIRESMSRDMSKKRTPYDGPCAVEGSIRIFGGKWKPAILFFLLQNGPQRFNQLRRQIPEVTQRMLTLQLRELERDGLVDRKDFEEKPPRVEYTATEIAVSLTKVFKAIEKWGASSQSAIQRSQDAFDRKHG